MNNSRKKGAVPIIKPPTCECKKECVLLQVKKADSAHLHRWFYKCNYSHNPCSFFVWKDEYDNAMQRALSGNSCITDYFSKA